MSISADYDSGMMKDPLIDTYLKDIQQFEILTPEQACDQFERLARGCDKARAVIVQAHMRLVVRIAKRSPSRFYVPLIDLIQEGNLALLVSLKTFDPCLGVPFNAYASRAISHAVAKAGWRQRGSMNPRAGEERPTSVASIEKMLDEGDGYESFSLPPAVDYALASHALRLQICQLVTQMPPLAGAVARLRFGMWGVKPLGEQRIEAMLDNLSGCDRLKRQARAIWQHQSYAPMTQCEVATVFGWRTERVRECERQALRYCRRFGRLELFWYGRD